jgi:hypothetical protein
LPELVTPAKAVGVGAAAAAHGGMLAKTTSLATLVISISGFVSAVLTLRANLDQSRTPRERRCVTKVTIVAFAGAMAFILAWYLLRGAAYKWWEHRVLFATIAQLLLVTALVFGPIALLSAMRASRALRSRERREHPECFLDPADQIGSAAGEYKSRWSLLGIPLVRCRFASPDEGDGPIIAWFAGGDRAYGLLFAWGGLAIAPFSVGAVSVGLFAVGSVSLGVISLGTFALGFLVIGCATIGVKAFAWLTALGWETAQSGGFAIARIAAEGPIALARHANDPLARAILADPNAERNHMVALTIMAVLSVVPIAYYARSVRQRLGRRKA